MKGCELMSLNGGYAMIKYNSTQEELQIAYRSKKPVLFYDENQRSHWAVIEETATESVDEETQEPITIYEYSYKLLDEASAVVANPTLSGNEATLDGLEVDGTKYKVGGGKLYNHKIYISSSGATITTNIVNSKSTSFTNSNIITYLNDLGYSSADNYHYSAVGKAFSYLCIGISANVDLGTLSAYCYETNGVLTDRNLGKSVILLDTITEV